MKKLFNVKRMISLCMCIALIMSIFANFTLISNAESYYVKNNNENTITEESYKESVISKDTTEVYKPSKPVCDYTLLNYALKLAANYPQENDGRFSKKAWNNYLNALRKAKSIKPDLTTQNKENQKKIDNAAKELINTIEILESEIGNKKVFNVYITNQQNETIQIIPVEQNDNVSFSEIKHLINITDLPDSNCEFIGWIDKQGNLISDDYIINSDLFITADYEYKSIIIKENIEDIVIVNDNVNKYIHGLDTDKNTVKDIVENFKNSDFQIIVSKNGKILEDEELVGTGSLVKCVSKKDSSVVYDTAEIILFGDINGDGRINNIDYKLISSSFFSTKTTESVYYIAADLDGDKAIDGFDYYILDKHLSGVKTLKQK